MRTKAYLKKYHKQWYQQNKERLNLKAKERRQINHEKIKETDRKYYRKHRKERSCQARKYYKKHRERIRLKHIFDAYSLTPEMYETLFIGQDFKCNICEREVFPYTREVHVDHNHATRRVRGILCFTCNIKLGWFEKNKKFVAYHLNIGD